MVIMDEKEIMSTRISCFLLKDIFIVRKVDNPNDFCFNHYAACCPEVYQLTYNISSLFAIAIVQGLGLQFHSGDYGISVIRDVGHPKRFLLW